MQKSRQGEFCNGTRGWDPPDREGRARGTPGEASDRPVAWGPREPPAPGLRYAHARIRGLEGERRPLDLGRTLICEPLSVVLLDHTHRRAAVLREKL